MPVEDLWTAATRHPFLDAVRTGTLPPAAFDRWLVQDALFVADLLRFQARLLARATRTAQPSLAGGCLALVEELVWFDGQAGRRALRLDAAPLPATEAYARLLEGLDAAPYEDAVTALWVLEEVYLRGWAHAAPATGAFQEFVEHWTAPGFAGYVATLRELASPDGRETLVHEVLAQEVAFWDMALDVR